MSEPEDFEAGAAVGASAAERELAQLNMSPRVTRLRELPQTPERLALHRLAAAGRDIIESMSQTAASASELDAASEHLEAVLELLKGYDSGKSYQGFSELANAGDLFARQRKQAAEGDPEAFARFDHSPFIGLSNPMSPPMVVDYDDDGVICEVTFGSAYEGPPNCVHGGYVAAAFDEVLGATQSLSGAQGMTARLVVNYRSPTPLHTPLRILGQFERREGRKIFVAGQMFAGERLTAEAEGLFIAFDPGKFRELLEAREQRSLSQ